MDDRDLTPQDNPRPKAVPAKTIPAERRGSGRTAPARQDGPMLTRMQCATCKTVLACDFDRRRKPMLCPVCGHVAPLVYLPPGSDRDTPINDLPLAKRPGLSRSRWLVPFLFFVLGLVAGVMVYALDYGQPIDRLARRIVNAVRAEFSESVSRKEEREARWAKAEAASLRDLEAEIWKDYLRSGGHCDRCADEVARVDAYYRVWLSHLETVERGSVIGVTLVSPTFIEKYRNAALRLDTEYFCGTKR